MSRSDAVAANLPTHLGGEPKAQGAERGRRGGFLPAFPLRGRLRRELEELGVRRSRSSDAPVLALAGLLLIAGASATIGAATHSLDTQTAVGLAAAVLTVAGLFVAVLQWRLGLSEKAFDALYHRIAMANEMRLEAFKDLGTDDEQAAGDKPSERYRFYVFTEIDSLEYAARRYRFGLGVSADIVHRAIRHFRSRCLSETFRDTAEACLEESAYFAETKCLVKSIVARARDDDEGKPDYDDGGNPIYPTWDEQAGRWAYPHREADCRPA